MSSNHEHLLMRDHGSSGSRQIMTTRFRLWLWVILLYVLGCVTRYWLLTYCLPNPYVVPDEMLYYNLSRSLHLGEGLTVRGQSVTFVAILYSLLLSPLYGLPVGNDIMGAAQLVNTLLMNAAVFPAFALAKRLGCNDRRSLLVAFVAILLPDLFMASRYMTESLLYPLLLLTLLAVSYLLSSWRWRYVLAVVFTGFLLFLTKEGSIAMLVAIGLILLWKAVRERCKRGALMCLVTAAAFVLLYFLWHLFLKVCLAVDFDSQGVYRYGGLGWIHLFWTAAGLLLYALFVPVGFGILPLLLPASHLRSYTSAHRWFVCFLLLALITYLVGTCYLIFVDEMYDGIAHSRIHLRYVFPFLPAFLAALSSPDLERVKLNRTLGVSFTVFLLLLFGIGLSTLDYGYIDAGLLSYLYVEYSTFNMSLLFTLVFTGLCFVSALYLHKRGWQQGGRLTYSVFLCCLLLVGNIFHYYNNVPANMQNEQNMHEDALIAAVMLDGKDALLVSDLEDSYQEGWFQRTIDAVDIQSTQVHPSIVLRDLCPQIKNDTIDIPAYWVAGGGQIDLQPSHLLLKNRHQFMVLEPTCHYEITPSGFYLIVTLPADGAWLHSVVCGIREGGQVTEESAFYLYNRELLAGGSVTLTFNVTADRVSSLALSSGNESKTFNVGSEDNSCQMTFSVPADSPYLCVNIRAIGDVYIQSYIITTEDGATIDSRD